MKLLKAVQSADDLCVPTAVPAAAAVPAVFAVPIAAGAADPALPPARKKPGSKVAGKHPLNGAPQAKKNFEPL